MVTMKVQCRDPQGRRGDFLFDMVRGQRISPLFNSLAELYPWMKANGWKHSKPFDKQSPWAVVR